MEEKLKGLFGGGEADDASAPSAAAAEAAPKPPRRRRRRRRSPEEIDRAQDFINRYTTGHPSEGYTSEEAIGFLREVREEVPPEVLQRAAVQTVRNLPADQRKAFAEMLQRRQQGAGMVTIERTGQAHAAEGRGGGQAGGMDDVLGGLFGSLLGGGMAPPEPEPRQMPRQAPQPQGQGGFGMDDMLGGLLGSILGGGAAQQPQGRGAPASDPFGDLLGGMLGGGMGMPAPEQAPPYRQQPQEQGGIGDMLGSPLGKAVLGGIAAYAMKEMLGGGKGGRA